ncbi:acyltransferase [Paenibacillus sp. UMB7766-LJ446]|uniref:acyltransferase family protein n=1 Tax=Paenibacillus sp. UMB7766-LJ446 TaxID=3046313 RepID=UPI00254F40EC|nr:acyltransferase [Paenibacillus sp. UMB7766-LJ446]MDK8189273.1 acyltransferase [Paenibacillus sp. UMB7766-LJ446]
MKLNTSVLNGLRLLLALWVVCGHFYIVIGGKNFIDIPFISSLLQQPIIAVNGFMLVTGFLMTYHYILREQKEPFLEAPTGIKFILRRLFRLYPVYFIAIIAAFFLVENMYLLRKEILEFFTGSSITVFGAESKLETPTLIGMFSHLFFLHGLIPHQDSTILSVAWSLSLEMQFYIIFPIIFAILFRKQTGLRFSIITLFSVALSVLSLNYLKSYFDMPAALFFRMPVFILGMMVAAAALKKIKWRFVTLNGLIILAMEDKLTIILTVGLIFLMFYENLKYILPRSIYSIISFFAGLLSNKLSKFGADISYSLYLIHMIIMPFIIKFFINFNYSKLLTAGLSFVSLLAITITLSYILYLYVEKPFIVMGKRLVGALPRSARIQAENFN